MYVIKELRLNGFKDVFIPTARKLYEKLGYSTPQFKGNVGKNGDFAEPVNLADRADKLTAISLGSRLMREEYEQSKRQSSEENRPQEEPTSATAGESAIA